jgi:hypothetical protein
MDNLIELEKNTLISMVSPIIFIAKKSPPTMKRVPIPGLAESSSRLAESSKFLRVSSIFLSFLMVF